VRQATFGREVLSVSEHFFVFGNVPHLTLVLSLGDAPQYENAGSEQLEGTKATAGTEGTSGTEGTTKLEAAT